MGEAVALEQLHRRVMGARHEFGDEVGDPGTVEHPLEGAVDEVVDAGAQHRPQALERRRQLLDDRLGQRRFSVTASARSAASAAWISGSEMASRATEEAVELSKMVARAHTATTESVSDTIASTPHTAAAVGRTHP